VDRGPGSAVDSRDPEAPSGLILVCGLGALGRACLRILLRFDVPLRGVDWQSPDWLVGDELSDLAQVVVIGDMRNPSVLLRAGVREARAVLVVTSDSGLNLEVALQARLLNPSARLVVRSSGGQGLERHLRRRLPGLAMVDPQLLTAGVFANALRLDGSEAAFTLEGEQVRVRREVLQSDSPDDLFALQERQRRLLQWCAPGRWDAAGEPASHWWDLREKPQGGDHLLWLEVGSPQDHRRGIKGGWLSLTRSRLRLAAESLLEGLRSVPQRWGRWQLAGWTSLLLVLLVGSARFGGGSPIRGLLLTAALLKGEYLDALGAMTGGASLGPDHQGMAALALVFALGGTLFTAWLVALVVDWLLARRLGRREPPALPSGSPYVLLVEGHRLALRLEGVIAQSRARVRRVQEGGAGEVTPAYANLERALRQLRHCRCQAVAVLGDDVMANLETALNLQETFPLARLAVRSQARGHGASLGQLFPGIEVIHPLELAADAVVATAFGERVREVLRVADSHLLLTDYQLVAGDTLVGRSLAAIAEGYGVMPLSLRSAGQSRAQILPSLERVLQPGDALVVLAPLSGLRAVEEGRLRAPSWRLELRGTGFKADLFEGKMLLARHFDQPPGAMGPYLDCRQGPRWTPSLHQASARLLESGLRRLGFDCALIPDASAPESAGEASPDSGTGFREPPQGRQG
jgi:Trk K+ transport system NAD-binding subunit